MYGHRRSTSPFGSFDPAGCGATDVAGGGVKFVGAPT